jgi:hypothetical protein
MEVTVDEAREDEMASELLCPGLGAGEASCIGGTAYEQDLAILYGDGFGERLRAIRGVDFSAGKDHVGGTSCGLRRGGCGGNEWQESECDSRSGS